MGGLRQRGGVTLIQALVRNVGNCALMIREKLEQSDCESVRVKFPRATRPLKAAIDLGLGVWTVQKLRLRGIDAPKLDTLKGKAAKKFVEEKIKTAVRIKITTTKPDKWDRYLSDIFLQTKDGREVFLNNLLLEKGLARRYDGVTLNDWGE